MFVIEAANINPDDYAWLTFTRQTKLKLTGYHQKHELRLERGDIFGVRRTRSNTYQLVKADAMHVLYRGLSEKAHNSIMKHSIPYEGPPPTPEEIEEGFVRRRKVNVVNRKRVANKRTDDYYKTPKERVIETFQIDFDDYQWRKVKSGPIKVTTKKQGKVRTVLHAGDFVGMRYLTPARGGYIIVDGSTRILISHELYTEIVHESRPLPSGQQRSGTIDLDSGRKVEKAPVEKKVRRKKVETPELPPEEPIEKLYDLDDLSEEEVLGKIKRRSRVQKNLQSTVKRLMEGPEQETWVPDDQEEFEQEEPTSEETEDEDQVETPGDEQPETEVPEDTDVEEEPEDEEEPEPEEGSEQDDETLADVLEPGTIIRMKKGSGRRFVVVDADIMERNENLMEYTLVDPDSEDDEEDDVMYHLRLGTHVKVGKFRESAEIEGTYDEKKLKPLQEKVQYANIKSMSLVK